MRNTVHVDVLVPLYGNDDGQPFSLSAFDQLEAFLLGIAGGFTRHGDVEGAWRSPDGRVFRDASRAYALSLSETDADGIARSIDAYICEHFAQEAAYLELVPTRATAF
jgi:hypothetical protein